MRRRSAATELTPCTRFGHCAAVAHSSPADCRHCANGGVCDITARQLLRTTGRCHGAHDGRRAHSHSIENQHCPATDLLVVPGERPRRPYRRDCLWPKQSSCGSMWRIASRVQRPRSTFRRDSRAAVEVRSCRGVARCRSRRSRLTCSGPIEHRAALEIAETSSWRDAPLRRLLQTRDLFFAHDPCSRSRSPTVGSDEGPTLVGPSLLTERGVSRRRSMSWPAHRWASSVANASVPSTWAVPFQHFGVSYCVSSIPSLQRSAEECRG